MKTSCVMVGTEIESVARLMGSASVLWRLSESRCRCEASVLIREISCDVRSCDDQTSLLDTKVWCKVTIVLVIKDIC